MRSELSERGRERERERERENEDAWEMERLFIVLRGLVNISHSIYVSHAHTHTHTNTHTHTHTYYHTSQTHMHKQAWRTGNIHVLREVCTQMPSIMLDAT